VSEIDYAEYTNFGGPTGQRFVVQKQFPDEDDVPGLAIVVPPQEVRYEVVGFVPLAQSGYFLSWLTIAILEVVEDVVCVRSWVSTIPQVHLVGSPPETAVNHVQTFAPVSVRARFEANEATKKYVLRVSRVTVEPEEEEIENPNWTLLGDAAGPNAAYLRADTL
jgi:hypothetical protein